MIEHSTFTLDNGLRVIVNCDTSTAMAAVNLMYDVGARDEDPGHTGLAHLFEHLMFGGSEHVPEFDKVIERAGGYSNAWTGNDFTNFYEVLPAVNLDTALYLESDRMLSPTLSDRSLEVQRGVVTEEFKQQCLNRPYGDMSHHMRALAYTVHPYRYPVIGKEIAHIADVDTDTVRRFFDTHYSPHRAVLAVSGNVTAESVRRSAEHWFGDIPRRDVRPRSYAAEPPQTAPRSATVYGNAPVTAINIMYRMGGYNDPDYIPADLLSDILSNGRSSRLYRRLLLSTDLFASVDASILGSEEPGLFLINARLNPGAGDDTVRRAIDSIDSAVTALADSEPPTQHELERVLNRYESTHTFNNISYQARATLLATATMHGEDVNDIVPRYRAVTREQLADTARQIFVPERRSTLIYKPHPV